MRYWTIDLGGTYEKSATYHYYVEGEDEKSLLDALKSELKCIESGKVEKFNVVQNRFTTARIRPLKYGAIIVLVYDTDVETNANEYISMLWE